MSNRIVWLTGKSGSGKTTLAERLRKDIDCIILDGDEMRNSISVDEGFSRGDREKHNLRVARLANVLSEQKMVIVSVIAPMQSVRNVITEICNPFWVYVQRTLPDKEGHFYEETDRYFTLNHDQLSIESSAHILMVYLGVGASKGPFSMMIGDYQQLQSSDIHQMRKVLVDEKKKVLVALRDTMISEKNPYSIDERKAIFKEAFPDEIKDGRMVVTSIPDISEVCVQNQ